jgi:hypothetical protein
MLRARTLWKAGRKLEAAEEVAEEIIGEKKGSFATSRSPRVTR